MSHTTVILKFGDTPNVQKFGMILTSTEPKFFRTLFSILNLWLRFLCPFLIKKMNECVSISENSNFLVHFSKFIVQTLFPGDVAQ